MNEVSRNNPRIRELRKIIRDPKERLNSGKFVVEGYESLKEAVSTGYDPLDVFISRPSGKEAEIKELLNKSGANLWLLDHELLSSIASTVTPQPVLATLPALDIPVQELLAKSPTFVVAGVEVNEPGNAGSIIRGAAAAGADGVVFSSNSVDVYNPKVVRSSAGSIFRIPIVKGIESQEIIESAKQNGLELIGLSANGEIPYSEKSYLSPSIIFLGNESRGMKPEHLKQMDFNVSIPMEAGVESLNVAAAAAVVSFEVKRQRSL